MRKKYFVFLHLKFNILLAQEIAAAYKSEQRKPNLDWINPLFLSKDSLIAKADLNKLIIFATIPQSGKTYEYLIDGNEIVVKANNEKVPFLNAVVLNISDTLAILCCKKKVMEMIEKEIMKLGTS